MNRWDQEAERLQKETRESEARKGEIFDDQQVRRAIIYTREDVVMIFVQLSYVNKNLNRLVWAAWITIGLIAVTADRVLSHFGVGLW